MRVEIKGMVAHSLVDWDGAIATTLFLPGCNFRCPWCYARALVLEPQRLPTIAFADIERHLKAHRRYIDGVVITGGEPTQCSELKALCARIKALGFKVKLDTNGSFPQVLRELIEQRLVDYVAMDVKAPLSERAYNAANGNKDALPQVYESIKLLLRSGINYEFRTTLVPGIHNLKAINTIASALKGAKRWALQQWVAKRGALIDPAYEGRKPFDEQQLLTLYKAAKAKVSGVVLRRAPSILG